MIGPHFQRDRSLNAVLGIQNEDLIRQNNMKVDGNNAIFTNNIMVRKKKWSKVKSYDEVALGETSGFTNMFY